jgi:glycosyltransferase involved in cell wall biosynthesis
MVASETVADHNLLYEDVDRQIKAIGKADIIVGIPSYNNVRTIEHVVRAVKSGFAKYFPGKRAILVNSDGGSTDGTTDLVRQTSINDYRTLLTAHPLQPIHKIITPYHGLPGKGSALRTVFKIATELDVEACAVVDADLRSITPNWVELLIGPVINEGFDYVAPLYHRHKYDGTITNSIVYPLTRALYGRRVRQPIGGDFGFSGRLAEHYLKHDVWHTDVARFGIDIWMTTTAISGGFKVCQSFLGAKIHDSKDPGVDLSSMLVQVVSSVFSLMEINHDYWRAISVSQPVQLFGFEYTVGLESVQVNVERMIEGFKTGARDLRSIWEIALSYETLSMITRIADNNHQAQFLFPDDLWVKVVYEYAIAWHQKLLYREHLIKSLTPLYLGRVASFVLSTENADSVEVESKLEDLCLEFEKQKPYLLEKWQA